MPSFAQFKGIRNTVPAERLEDDDLAAAVNVDLDDTGRVTRRPGRALVSAGAADSLFSNGTLRLFRRSNGLYRLNEDNSATLLRSGVVNRVSYWAEAGAIYYSDELVTGVIERDGSVHGWGVTPPAWTPPVAVVDGSLPTGRYQLAMTYLRRDGEESGASRAAVLESASGGLSFTSLPVSPDPDVDRKVIYLTRPNGKTLYRALVLANATTAATYRGDTTDLLAALETQFKQPPPAPSCMGMLNGRMVIGADRFVLFSDAYRPERFDPVRQQYQFADRVTMVAPVKGGVFVGTDKEIAFLAGEDIAEAVYVRKFDRGALRGSLAYVDADNTKLEAEGPVAVFATQGGICVGAAGGAFANLTSGRYVYDEAVGAAGAVRLRNSLNQYIAVLRGA